MPAWVSLAIGRVFPARDARDLAVFRIAVALTLLAIVSPRIAAHFAVYPQELCFPPGEFMTDVYQLFGGIRVDPFIINVVNAIFVPAAIATALGFYSRTSALLMLLTSAYLLTLPQFFGKIVHYNHLVWFAMLLPISPCGDAWSIDAWRKRRRLAPAMSVKPPAISRRSESHIAYGIPLQCVVILIGIAYFFPGLWKLIAIGPEWASSDNIIHFLHAKWREYDPGMNLWWWQASSPASSATDSTQSVHLGDGWIRVDRFPSVCSFIGISTIIFELLFLPLALWRRTRRFALIAGLLFHLGIYLTMGIGIGHLAVGYVALVKWGKVQRTYSHGTAPQGTSRHSTAAHGHRSGCDDVPGDHVLCQSPRVFRPWPALLVGSLLILGNIHNGITRRNDWPLGEYPTFAFRAGPNMAYLDITATMPSGQERLITESMLGRYTEPSRARGLGGILLFDNPPIPSRLAALWQVWTRLDPSLSMARHVRFERVHIATHPDKPRIPIGRELLWELDPSKPWQDQVPDAVHPHTYPVNASDALRREAIVPEQMDR